MLSDIFGLLLKMALFRLNSCGYLWATFGENWATFGENWATF